MSDPKPGEGTETSDPGESVETSDTGSSAATGSGSTLPSAFEVPGEGPVNSPRPSAKMSWDPKKNRKEAARERAAQLIGRVISDRYLIEEVLAVGGMGCVYRGSHVHMRKRVAIKLLLPETEGLPDLVARFQREAVAGAHINHPNVAAATDFGKLEDGSFFLVLEFVSGITLHDLIKQGPVPPVRAVRIARQLAAALDAGHQMGVIHRDLKPRNVMLEEAEKDSVKLIDFGLAKVPVDRLATAGMSVEPVKAREITGAGVVFGTIAYMAPEAAFGMDAVNERSDLYALGVILYEMLAGVHPFDGQDPSEIFRQHRTQPPPPLRVRSPGVDVAPRLEAVVMRLLQKDPSDRFENARAVIAALDAAMPSAALDFAGASLGSAAPQQGRLAGSIGQGAPMATVMPVVASAEITAASVSAAAKAAEQSSTDAMDASGAGASQEAYVPRLAGRPAKSKGPERAMLVAIGALAAGMAFAAAFIANRTNTPAPGASVTASAPASAPAPASATASASASAPAPASATAPASAVVEVPAASSSAQAGPPSSGSESSAALRVTLREAADGKAWRKASATLIELAAADPAAFKDRDVMSAAVTVATNLELGASDKVEEVFTALGTKAGTGGPDVLYELLSTRGGSKAAARATEMLRRKDVLEHSTPALRIAVELREIACKDKLSLLERAKTDGDLRAVAVLDILRSDSCNPRVGQCCFRRNVLVEETIHLIRARLRAAAP